MSLLDSIFSGVKAFLRETVVFVKEAVKAVLTEIDNSTFGKAATTLVRGVTQRYFSAAQDLADEERELAAKHRRDGRFTDNDRDRLRQIEAERDSLRLELDAVKARTSAEQLREAQDEVIAARVTGDDAAASVGMLATKVCPECGGTMRIQVSGFDTKANTQRFFWQCSAKNPWPCPSIKLDPEAERASLSCAALTPTWTAHASKDSKYGPVLRYWLRRMDDCGQGWTRRTKKSCAPPTCCP